MLMSLLLFLSLYNNPVDVMQIMICYEGTSRYSAPATFVGERDEFQNRLQSR